MTANQLYSLTWGDFGTSLISAVQLLRCHGDLVDVTLAAGGRCFSAHKIVLCAASPFLLDLLKSTPCKHPVVMLAGVTAADLEALLEFVYRGEVSIDPSQLPSLLQAAHCLNIQGLAPESNDSHQNNIQNTIKAVIDMVKSDDITNNTAPVNDSLTRDVINSLLPMRRKRRMKRKSSITLRNKWPRQDVTGDRLLQTPSVPVTNHDNVSVNETSTEVWHESELNFTTVNVTSGQLESTNQILVNAHLPQASTSMTSAQASRVRSASDQPGTCPLCGSMLRQARNLRRHLLTSCKYRDTGEALQHEQRIAQREPDLHQLQPAAMSTVERVIPNSVAHLDSKSSALSTVECSSIIVSDCNNMSSTLK